MLYEVITLSDHRGISGVGSQSAAHDLKGRAALALEGALPGQHLEGHYSQRIDVRPRVQRFTAALLRRHIARRAGHRGQRRCKRPRAVRAVASLAPFEAGELIQQPLVSYNFV